MARLPLLITLALAAIAAPVSPMTAHAAPPATRAAAAEAGWYGWDEPAAAACPTPRQLARRVGVRRDELLSDPSCLPVRLGPVVLAAAYVRDRTMVGSVAELV